MDILKKYIQIHFFKNEDKDRLLAPKREYKLTHGDLLGIKRGVIPNKWIFEKFSLPGSKYIYTSSVIVLELGEWGRKR